MIMVASVWNCKPQLSCAVNYCLVHISEGLKWSVWVAVTEVTILE